MTDRQTSADLFATSASPTTPPADLVPPAVPVPPADPFAQPPADASAQPTKRRPRAVLRTALRWVAVALVLGLSGTATAFAVMTPDRTDIPGLHTAPDGRYTFPDLTLPGLPSDKPSPLASGNGGRHWASLPALLVPAPQQAVARTASTSAASSAKGCTAYSELFTVPTEVSKFMTESACRRSARRSWTTPDGTRTEIRLLGFGSEPEAQSLYVVLVENKLRAVPNETSMRADDYSLPWNVGGQPVALREKIGGEQHYVACAVHLKAGDLIATIVMTNPKGVSEVAFRQVVTLQADLLG